MLNVGRILFPFKDDYRFLNNKWWHRLMKIIFYFIILIGFIIALFSPFGGSDSATIKLNVDNTNRTYVMDNIINIIGPPYKDSYKLACYEGLGTTNYKYLYGVGDTIDAYKKEFLNLNVMLNAPYEGRLFKSEKKSRLSKILKNVYINNGTFVLKRNEGSKTVSIERDNIEGEKNVFCIYGGEYFEDIKNDNTIFYGYTKNDCQEMGYEKMISIRNDYYDELFDDTAEKMLSNSGNKLRGTYNYRRENSDGFKIYIAGIDLNNEELQGCNIDDVVEYSPNILFYIENISINIVILATLFFLMKIFYYKVVIYIIYGNNINKPN